MKLFGIVWGEQKPQEEEGTAPAQPADGEGLPVEPVEPPSEEGPEVTQEGAGSAPIEDHLPVEDGGGVIQPEGEGEGQMAPVISDSPVSTVEGPLDTAPIESEGNAYKQEEPESEGIEPGGLEPGGIQPGDVLDPDDHPGSAATPSAEAEAGSGQPGSSQENEPPPDGQPPVETQGREGESDDVDRTDPPGQEPDAPPSDPETSESAAPAGLDKQLESAVEEERAKYAAYVGQHEAALEALTYWKGRAKEANESWMSACAAANTRLQEADAVLESLPEATKTRLADRINSLAILKRMIERSTLPEILAQINEQSFALQPEPDGTLSESSFQSGDEIAECVARLQAERWRALDELRNAGERQRSALQLFVENYVLRILDTIFTGRRYSEDLQSQAGDEEGGNEQLASWLATYADLDKMFAPAVEKIGVTVISPQRGDAFDSHLHEALGAEADSELPNDAVREVMGNGYMLQGREGAVAIRCSLVVVVSNPKSAEDNA